MMNSIKMRLQFTNFLKIMLYIQAVWNICCNIFSTTFIADYQMSHTNDVKHTFLFRILLLFSFLIMLKKSFRKTVYVLFGVLPRPLEAQEEFFDSKNGFPMKFYVNLMGHVQIFGFKQMYSLFYSKYGPPHPVYSLRPLPDKG